MSSTARNGTDPAHPRSRRGGKILAIEIAGLLLLTAGMGVLLGWYGLNPPQGEMLSPTGSEAHELLSGFPDSHLVVEIAYQSGAGAPPASAIATLESRINETCSKSSVTVALHSFTDPRSSFTDADLVQLATTQRETWPTPGTMSLFYLYLSGSYAVDGNVLGLAFRGSSIAVFAGTLEGSASSSEVAPVAATVLVHEFGHELGLVGIVGSAPNEDPAHPYHSSDPNDVMYWSVDSTAVLLGVLGGPPPPSQFDAADLNDLSTVRSTIIPLELLPWIALGGIVLIVLLVAVVHVRGGCRRVSARPPPASPGAQDSLPGPGQSSDGR